LRFAELCDGIFPPGVVNVVTGDAIAGSALVRHPDVSRIAFIGSVETGRIIAREAAEGLKEVSLELGGKNPIIIFPDADAGVAASLVLKGMNLNRQGQSCSSTSRVFVHESLHDEVVERLVEGAEKYRIGLPWEDDTDVGPVVSKDQYDRVMGFIESAKAEGAKLLTGGGRPDDEKLARGFFISPTVFDGVTPEMRIARQEIFGPVMSVLSWRDYEQMMETANGVMYGLTAAIVTNDLKLAMRTADRIQAGYVWINSSGRYLGAPYGGWKQSGLGREESLDELLSYTQIKNINLAW
jgi:betaine-aldehyde dehydrogenase